MTLRPLCSHTCAYMYGSSVFSHFFPRVWHFLYRSVLSNLTNCPPESRRKGLLSPLQGGQLAHGALGFRCPGSLIQPGPGPTLSHPVPVGTWNVEHRVDQLLTEMIPARCGDFLASYFLPSSDRPSRSSDSFLMEHASISIVPVTTRLRP